MLKYDDYKILFQEVPTEVSLVFFITNCPYKCEGCHSPHLQEDIGNAMIDNFEEILNMYGSFVSCVCFMGGDQESEELIDYLKTSKEAKLKTCLYTGSELEEVDTSVLKLLDYIKVGKYNKNIGALNSEATNQHFYVLNEGEVVDEKFFYDKKGIEKNDKNYR